MSSKRIRKWSGNLAKLTLVAMLLYFLAQKGLLSLSDLKRTLAFPQLLGLALLASLGSMILSIARWKVLLLAQGIALTWPRVIQLSFIGNFFNLALPGAVSGDLVKAYYIAREFPGKRGHAFGSILFDRIVGVSGLVLISATAMLSGYRTLHENHVFQAIQWFVAIAGVGVITFFGYLFVIPEKHDPALGLLLTLQRRIGKMSSIVRIYEGIRNYHSHKKLVTQSLLMSCVIHLFAATSCILFTFALEAGNGVEIQPIALFALAPLGLLATAVPLAPAGVGTGHAAFSWLFLLIGYKTGANVFSMLVLYQIFWGSLGGLTYLKYRSEIPQSILEAKT